MKPRRRDRTRRDLEEGGRFIARDNRDAARKWIARLRHRATKAAAIPEAGRIVPEVGKPDLREVIVGNYRIVYQMTGKTVTLLTVFEGHRLLHLTEPPRVNEKDESP